MTNMLKKCSTCVQLVRVSSFRNDLLQNPYFSNSIDLKSVFFALNSWVEVKITTHQSPPTVKLQHPAANNSTILQCNLAPNDYFVFNVHTRKTPKNKSKILLDSKRDFEVTSIIGNPFYEKVWHPRFQIPNVISA